MTEHARTHATCPATAFDVVLLDLDGVVYVGDHPVPRAAEAIERMRQEGLAVGFVTNNASRTPQQVAEKLARVGVKADASDVVTSAQAAARLVAERQEPGSRIAVLGAEGLRWAVEERGFVATTVDDPEAVALVSGFGPDVVWRDIMLAAQRIREGLSWVASNTDATFPTAQGPAPGHGALVRLLSTFAEVEPPVGGKPAPALLTETLARLGDVPPERALMVGDRLDTDVDGGIAVGCRTMLVLTGVDDVEAALARPAAARPDFVSADLMGVFRAHRPTEPDSSTFMDPDIGADAP